MKKEKLSLKSIKNKLSRAELKEIMAGSGGQCIPGGQACGVTTSFNCCFPFTCVTNQLGFGACNHV